MKIKYMLIILMLVMFLVPTVIAVESLGTFKQNDCVRLLQVCDNCTYVNISSVMYPEGTQALGMNKMTKLGTEYNYSYCNTSQLGKYIVNTYGDDDTVITTASYDFEITPTGVIGGFAGTLGFYILILVVSFVILFLGFWLKDEWIVVFGTFGLYFMGIYVLIFGIVGFKDVVYTYSFAIIMLGIAAYISIQTMFEKLQDLF